MHTAKSCHERFGWIIQNDSWTFKKKILSASNRQQLHYFLDSFSFYLVKASNQIIMTNL